jgi:DNA-binding transcriptional LysR family regulator
METIMEADRLLGIEIRHLLALQAVAREGSFGGAARSLGYTQSAISQQIAALERAVGERLLERPGGPRPVSLTEAGELLLRHADAIVARMKAAQADLAAYSEGAAGALRIGSYQSVSARILPTVVRRFKEAWPKVDVQLRESASDDELEELLERGETDLSFVMLPVHEGAPLEAEQLLVDPYVLIVPKGSPFANRAETPTLREIAEQSLIAYRHCRTTAAVEAEVRRSGVDPNVVFRSDDNGTVQGLVAAGVGIALVPRLTLQPAEDVLVIDMSERLPPRLIGVAWHRDRYRTPAARAFVETARELCAADQIRLVAA